MGFVERCEEMDRWYEEHPNLTYEQMAERLIPLRVRGILSGGENLGEVTEYLHTVWLANARGDGALTVRQAARIAVPAIHDRLQEQGRLGEMKAWMQKCFFEHGLDRDAAEQILRDAQRDALNAQREGAA